MSDSTYMIFGVIIDENILQTIIDNVYQHHKVDDMYDININDKVKIKYDEMQDITYLGILFVDVSIEIKDIAKYISEFLDITKNIYKLNYSENDIGIHIIESQ